MYSQYQYHSEDATMTAKLVFLLVVGLAATFSVNANPTPHHRALHDDLEAFVSLLPKDEILGIFLEYLKHDAEVQYVVQYVQSHEFRELVKDVESIPDVIYFYKYLQESGLDVYYVVNLLHEFIGLPPLFPPIRSKFVITGGVAGLIADIKAVLPIEDIEALYNEKLETSAEFKNLVERLQSPKFQAVVDILRANPEFQEIVKKAKAVGVDVEAITDLLTTVLGLEFPKHKVSKLSRDLHQDFEDFFALVPTEKVAQIIVEYLKHDAQVQYVVEYVKSSEFRELVKAVESISDVVNFYNYLQESGLDVYYLVNQLHEFIGLPPLLPPMRSTFAITGGVVGLIADIKAVLPIEDIKALYNEKLETSAEFKNLVERLQSPKFQAVVDTLRANPEFQEIVKKAKAVGVDVEAITDLLTTVLGLEFPKHKVSKLSRDLHQDFEDFFALVPTEKVAQIIVEYLKHDAQVQYVVEYVKSSEFRELVKAVESISDVVNFYNYLQESGLDVYYLVNQLHEFIGLPPLLPPMRSTFAITGGVVGLIADIKAVLPIEDIKALYNEKLETSAEFKNLVERLQSPKFQAVVDTLRANPEFQEIVKKAKEVGVDVVAITDLLSAVLGLKFPSNNSQVSTRTLHFSFDDFLNLHYAEVVKVFEYYSSNDKEIMMLLHYFRTQEFENIVESIDHIANVRYMYQYLDESGLDIYRIVNALRRAINLPEIQARKLLVTASSGLRGLFSDVQLVFPIREFIALHREKLQSDPIYKVFIGKIHSTEFKNVVTTVVSDPDFATAAAELQSSGFDVEFVIEVVENLLNFHGSELLKRSLRDDMDDFIRLMPLNDIAEITLKYVLHDDQVQGALRYIQSQEFRELVIRLQKDSEVYEFLKYFEDSGAHVIDLIDVLNNLLNIPPYPLPDNFMGHRGGMGGVQEMLKEIHAIIPFDAIESMYENKMEHSGAFRYFIERFQNPAFQKIIDTMVRNGNVIELGYQAQLHGINIKIIAKFLTEIFGIQLPETCITISDSLFIEDKNSLSKDFAEFFDLLPMKEIVAVTVDYLLHDKEMQEVLIYIRSEQFKNIIRSLHEISEYQQILQELESAGVDIKYIIDFLHELIGPEGSFRRYHYNQLDALRSIEKPGLSGYIETLKELLPHKEIKALYQNKLETSKAFAEFVGLMSSETFQTLTNKLFENKDFQDLLLEAMSHGVNLQAISDFFLRVFGIKTPPGIIDYK